MEVRPRKIPRGGKLTSDQVSKLGRDIQITQRHLAVFSELLSELVPGQEHPEDLEMLVGVAATSQEMQDRVMELLGAVDSPEITASLLDINDKMNSEMERYKRYRAKCANRAASKKDPEVRLGLKYLIASITILFSRLSPRTKFFFNCPPPPHSPLALCPAQSVCSVRTLPQQPNLAKKRIFRYLYIQNRKHLQNSFCPSGLLLMELRFL